MANYSAIKNATNAYIRTNGRQEITGNILNAVMVATIESLGRFYQFAGVATPETDPADPDQNVAYIAGTEGTYENLGEKELEAGEIAILKYNGVWVKETLYHIPVKVSEVTNDLGYITNAVSDLVNYYTKGETYTRDEVASVLSSYYDKDEVDSIVAAINRQSYVEAWDGASTPVPANIPAGVTVTYSGDDYTGTLAPSASTIGNIYLVKNGAGYDMYVTSQDSDYTWIYIGSTTIDLSGYATNDDLKELSDHIEEDILRNYVDIDPSYYYGADQVDSSGAVSHNSGCMLYRIPVSNGDVLSAYCQASNSYAALSFSTDANPVTVTMAMMHIGGAKYYYTYKAPDDGYIFVLASINTTVKILHRKGETDLEAFGVSKFTYGSNALQPYVGSNVTDTDIWGSGYLNSSGSVTSASNYHYTKDYIPVLPGAYVSRIAFSSNARLVYYDKDKSVLGALSTGNTTSSVSRTLPANTAYIRVSLNGSNTNTLAMVFQDKGDLLVNVSEINDLDTRVTELESGVTKVIENNFLNEFDKIKDAGWAVKTVRGGSFDAMTEANYGLPSVQTRIPIDPSAMVLHIKFDFKLSNGMLQYNGASLNQPLVTVKSYTSYQAAIRQQDSLYNTTSGLLTRRQFFIVRKDSDVSNVTLGDQNRDALIGEPAYCLYYKGNDYANVNGYKINLTSAAVTVTNNDTVMETISIDEGESVESVINKINANSTYLSAQAYQVAGVKYSDTLLISNIPLCTSTGTRPVVVRCLLDQKWHSVEIVIDYNKLKSWTNIDGYTLRQDVAINSTGYIYLGGEVDSTIGLAPFSFRNIRIAYSYEDAEVISYPDNVSGTLERLISDSNPYLMVFEGHGIEDKTNTVGTVNNMDVTTDRLRTVFDYLRGKGFLPVSWQQVKDWRLNGVPLPKRSYTLMFDDFRIENYMDLKLRKPFVQFDVKPGLAIITGNSGGTRSRSEEVTIDGNTWTLGECFDAIEKGGWYPCSHTRTHTPLDTVAMGNFLDFVKDCIYSCDKLGVYDDILVYPEGRYVSNQLELMMVSGLALGVAVSVNGYNCRARNRFLFIRNEIGQRKALADVLAQIV